MCMRARMCAHARARRLAGVWRKPALVRSQTCTRCDDAHASASAHARDLVQTQNCKCTDVRAIFIVNTPSSCSCACMRIPAVPSTQVRTFVRLRPLAYLQRTAAGVHACDSSAAGSLASHKCSRMLPLEGGRVQRIGAGAFECSCVLACAVLIASGLFTFESPASSGHQLVLPPVLSLCVSCPLPLLTCFQSNLSFSLPSAHQQFFLRARFLYPTSPFQQSWLGQRKLLKLKQSTQKSYSASCLIPVK
uniref:Uncharacterized protein n=1 Tax=Chrysotila carterae TaxID=13221 RepID=A0A6T0E3Q3_CHRCT